MTATSPLKLTGRTILVTGGSSGIGRATSVLLSQLGARVVIVGRDEARLQATLAELHGLDHGYEVFDLSRVEFIPEWFARVVGSVGPLGGLVCAAGVSSVRPLRALKLQHAEEMMRTNFFSAMVLTATFAKRAMHTDRAGVVLVASVAGTHGVPGRCEYSASKGALIAFARSAAIELAGAGVRVNCVAPAFVRTPLYENDARDLSPEQAEALVKATQPLGLGEPIDVANAIAFLLAETGRWITGSVLNVDGGYSAQ